jgi:hypothetical protein
MKQLRNEANYREEGQLPEKGQLEKKDPFSLDD